MLTLEAVAHEDDRSWQRAINHDTNGRSQRTQHQHAAERAFHSNGWAF